MAGFWHGVYDAWRCCNNVDICLFHLILCDAFHKFGWSRRISEFYGVLNIHENRTSLLVEGWGGMEWRRTYIIHIDNSNLDHQGCLFPSQICQAISNPLFPQPLFPAKTGQALSNRWGLAQYQSRWNSRGRGVSDVWRDVMSPETSQ